MAILHLFLLDHRFELQAHSRLVAQSEFDPLGSVLYLVCICLEAGIFASHVMWRIRTRKLHRRAKILKVSFDDLDETEQYRVPVLRRGSVAFARGMSDGTLGQFHRRSSMAHVLGDLARQASVNARRNSILAKANEQPKNGSTTLGNTVIIEEEVAPDPNSAGSEAPRRQMDVEQQGDYGTINAARDDNVRAKNKREPSPGRGESFFRELNWTTNA